MFAAGRWYCSGLPHRADTARLTGVLIYLSLDEHRAEIVADKAIAYKVPAEVWGEAMAAAHR